MLWNQSFIIFYPLMPNYETKFKNAIQGVTKCCVEKLIILVENMLNT